MSDRADIVVAGAGAAGLMAAIHAARAAPGARVVVLDSARKLGAKILIAGGGRCNVTHERVAPEDFAGSSRHSIRKVLGRFDVERTIAFFNELGVELKREDTGKLFPTTDRARTVLRALLDAAAHAHVAVRHPRRIDRIAPSTGGLVVAGAWGEIVASRVVLATGGRSLPRTGSDGGGYELARSLGHSTTEHVFPALVPLRLPDAHPLRSLSGSSTLVVLAVRGRSGKRLASCRGALLCTHFGVSGPAVLDVSRYFRAAAYEDAGAVLVCDWLPDFDAGDLDAELRAAGATSVHGRLKRHLPERLARTLCEIARVDPALPLARLAATARRTLVGTVKEMPLPVAGDRGWDYAEVTAGGIPLAEIDPTEMRSRVCAGLYLCGEICDVDGRIGGFNFQWAWASGYVAGMAAARAHPDTTLTA